MKTVRSILAAFYLLQAIFIFFTCYFAVKAVLIPLPAQDPNDDSFGAGIAAAVDALKPMEIALVVLFLLLFFIFSLLTGVLLLLQKNYVVAFALSAGCSTLAAVISTWICFIRGDLGWGLGAGAEVLLGVVAIVVMMVSIRRHEVKKARVTS